MESLLDSEIKREEVKKGPLHNSKVGQNLASRDARGSELDPCLTSAVRREQPAKSARSGDDFTPHFTPSL